jgi:hypothetical protein
MQSPGPRGVHRVVRGGDRGDIVIGWLVRLVVALAVVGVLAFDGLSLLVARLAVTDSAATAAREAGQDLTTGGTPQGAYLTAVEAVVEDNTFNEVPAEAFLVGPAGEVTLTVLRKTPTLVLRHVPRSESWLTVSATATYDPA